MLIVIRMIFALLSCRTGWSGTNCDTCIPGSGCCKYSN